MIHSEHFRQTYNTFHGGLIPCLLHLRRQIHKLELPDHPIRKTILGIINTSCTIASTSLCPSIPAPMMLPFLLLHILGLKDIGYQK